MRFLFVRPSRRGGTAASFRSHLAVDTLAVRLTVPPVGPVEDLHLQVRAPCRAHKDNKGGLDGVKLTRNFPAAVLNETINGKNPGGMAKRSIPL